MVQSEKPKNAKDFQPYTIEALNDKDVSNALQSLAHFEHLDYEVMSLMITHTIENCEPGKKFYSMQSLALVCNSLSRLGVKNQVLFDKVKEYLLQKGHAAGWYEDGQLQFQKGLKPFLNHIDCSQFMTAFCRNGFYESSLFYLLEVNILLWLGQIEEAQETDTSASESVTASLITIFCAHQEWCRHML